MAICAKHGKGKIDVFVAVTSNPNWREVQEQLLPGKKAQDRCDIISRVFQMKLKAIEKDLYSVGIFGRSIAHLRVIEFQKKRVTPCSHLDYPS